MKFINKALITLGVLGVSIASANIALSNGAAGTGSIQSAVPLAHKMIEFSTGFDYATGTDIGLTKFSHVDESSKDFCGYDRVTEVDEDPFLSGLKNIYKDGYVCPLGTINGPIDIGEASRLDLRASIAYGLTPFLETSLTFPYYQDSQDGTTYAGLGDIRASFKLNYPPYMHNPAFELSYLLQFDFPTGDVQSDGGYVRQATSVMNAEEVNGEPNLLDPTKDGVTSHLSGTSSPGKGQSAYTTTSVVTLMRLLMTANFKDVEGMIPARMHLNFGLALSDSYHANMFMAGGGLEFWIVDQLALFYSAETQVNVGHTNKHIPILDYPIFNKVGLELAVPQKNFTIQAGVSRVTNNNERSDYYTNYRQKDKPGANSYSYSRYPNFSLFAGLSVGISLQEKDTDGDGVKDKSDRCPLDKEDLDNFEDEDGCPEIDNDLDGINDINDKCPMEPEDKDDFEDEDGCIDLDNDRDKVNDTEDKCPMQAEDIDGYEDEDGCPELDNDSDGITDNYDKCPLKAEDIDGFQDTDGCPELDNDNDGIPDAADKCPDKPEILNGINDSDGCPDAEGDAPATLKGTEKTKLDEDGF